MNDQERQNLFDKKMEREYRKMMADIEHDVELRVHWKAQKIFWILTFLLGVIAIAANAYVRTH